jgi:hypothetical protein
MTGAWGAAPTAATGRVIGRRGTDAAAELDTTTSLARDVASGVGSDGTGGGANFRWGSWGVGDALRIAAAAAGKERKIPSPFDCLLIPSSSDEQTNAVHEQGG